MQNQSSAGSITRMISQLDLDNPSQAQEAIWNRYFHRLVVLARAKLGNVPRRVADEEDVAAAALASFFEDHRQGMFPSLHDRDGLWPLLTAITAHKAVDQQRQVLAKKRGAGQTRGDSIQIAAGEDGTRGLEVAVDDEPTPEHLASMCEECDRLLALLDSDELRLIARRRLAGYTNKEIAGEICVIERTIERRVKLIRTIWAGEVDRWK